MDLKQGLGALALALLALAGCSAPERLPLEPRREPAAEHRPPDARPAVPRAALKQILRDPHFNRPDPFAPYSEDFTAGEPIPPAMLETLVQARTLLSPGVGTTTQTSPGFMARSTSRR